MRQTLLWIAALTASVVADPLTTIPLYRRNNDGFVKASADELDNGVVMHPFFSSASNETIL